MFKNAKNRGAPPICRTTAILVLCPLPPPPSHISVRPMDDRTQRLLRELGLDRHIPFFKCGAAGPSTHMGGPGRSSPFHAVLTGGGGGKGSAVPGWLPVLIYFQSPTNEMRRLGCGAKRGFRKPNGWWAGPGGRSHQLHLLFFEGERSLR